MLNAMVFCTVHGSAWIVMSIPPFIKSTNVDFDVEMYGHRRALTFTDLFELLPASTVRLDMHTVRLVGGVVADQVVR
jgi:hypothetical protein